MLPICNTAPQLCRSWDSNTKLWSQLWEGLKQTPSGLEDALKPMLNLARPSWSHLARCPGMTKGPSGSSHSALALTWAKLLPQQWLHVIAWLPESSWERPQSRRWDARWEMQHGVKSISCHWAARMESAGHLKPSPAAAKRDVILHGAGRKQP